jgi:hypothetical protein
MRLSRAYLNTPEFEARQMGFDFAVVARAVLEIARATKAKLQTMARDFIKALRPATPAPKRPQQLVLELGGIAQAPLFSFQGV